MTIVRVVTLILLGGIFAAKAFAQTAQEVQFWKKAVAEKPLVEIAKLVSDPATPPWPKAKSVHFIKTLSGEAGALAGDTLALVKALHEKTQREFVRVAPEPNDDSETYSNLAIALERAGGYNNLLLADSFRRLGIFRLSATVVRRSRPLADVRQEVERITVPHVEIRDLLERLADDDNALNRSRAALGRIAPGHDVYAALQTAGIGEASSLAGQPFSQLLENPSAVALMLRMAGTELLYTVSLKGLLTFLEKGGTFEELNPADITAFKARMRGAEKSFKYAPLAIRSLSVSQTRRLFELHAEPRVGEVFLKVALD